MERYHQERGRRFPFFMKMQDKQFTPLTGDDLTLRAEQLDTFGTTCNVTVYAHQNALYQANEERNVENLNASVDMVNGIRPETPLEGMLAVQMAVCHRMAMAFAGRAFNSDSNRDQVDAQVNRTVKLMKVFNQQLEALNRLRNGGKQSILVQHQSVNVNQGQQQIVHQSSSQG
ncbi:MAG: hypothetical protein VKK59_06170 [Vampirovibrionales bacterium]|nr:hypothetical protein [Vampirovibrionales bacterium]